MNWNLRQSRVAVVLSKVSMGLNGWTRLGIVLSVLWMVGWTAYKSESQKSEAREYARGAELFRVNDH